MNSNSRPYNIFFILVSVVMVLSYAIPASADVSLTGEKTDRAFISNPPGDWHALAAARYDLDWFASGLDAGQAGDRLGYRLFGGSSLERNDNELTIPIEVTRTAALHVTIDVLAVDGGQPLTLWLDDQSVATCAITGKPQEHLIRDIALTDVPSGYHLLRIINATSNQVALISAVRIKSDAVHAAAPMHVFQEEGQKYLVPRSLRQDGAFRLWQFGRYDGGCAERRSYDREMFRPQRMRIKMGGYRQPGGTHDAWHLLYDVTRNPDGRQVENWAMLDRSWFGDMSAMQQTRGFQIAFMSPYAGNGRLVLYCTPNADATSMTLVVNGDANHARIGTGQKGVPGPGGLEIDNDPTVKEQYDVQPNKVTVYADIPVRKGRNTIDFDFQGIEFMWPAKTFRGLSENFDYMYFELTPSQTMAAGQDAEFTELPLAGQDYTTAAQIKVDLGTRWEVDGKSAISKDLFGLTTNHAGSGLTTKEAWEPLKTINIGCISGGIGAGFWLPADTDSKGTQAALDKFEQQWAAHNAWQPWASSAPLAMGTTLGIDCHTMIVVGGYGTYGQSCSPAPTEIDAWADNVARVIAIAKKQTPQLEYIFITGEDEPILHSSWMLRGADPTNVSGVEYLSLMERKVMERVHRQFPDIKLVGPTNWGMPFGGADGCDFVGDRWNDWVKPFLDNTWDGLYGFSFHNYFQDYTCNYAGELQSLTNYMQLRFGNTKPIYMTEGHLGGFEWSPWVKYDERELWLYDAFPIMRSLLFGVQHLDKLQGMCWHDYCSWPAEEWATRRDPAVGLPAPKPRPDLGEASPMPLWTALWLFRELRGDTVKATADAGAQVVAAYDGHGYSIVVLNHSLSPRDLHIQLAVPAGRKIADVTVESLESGDDFYRFDAGQLSPDRWERQGDQVTIQAKPLAGYHLRITLDQAVSLTHTAGLKEYFGDQVAVTLDRETPRGQIRIHCPSSVRKAKQAWLRVAYESLLMEPEEVVFSLNGHPVTIDQRYFIEIPVNPADLKKVNTFAFSLRDPAQRNSFRVRSATIVTEY